MSKKSFDKKGAEEVKVDEKILNEEEVLNNSKKENEGDKSSGKNDDIKDEPQEKSEESSQSTENEDNAQKELEEKKRAEEENLNNKLLRLQADFLNYKNRTEKEKFSTYGNAVADVIECILPVLDNLERALATDKSADNSFKDGIQMVYTQFVGILDKKGLKEIDALHKQFDHNLHYGVAFDDKREEPDGTVIEVLQKGYTVNDKVIRPSMVRIAKK